MQSTATLKRHASLVDRMASRLGIDLEESALRGRLSISEIDDAVLRCTACTRPCECQNLIDTSSSVAESAPAFCRNAELFDVLKS